MKVSSVETYVLKTPLQQPFAYSQGWFHARTAMIVRVLTDAGIEGIGECFGPPDLTAAVVEKAYAPILIGRDPLDNEVIWEELYNHLRDHGQKGIVIEALSGVDIALWDIKGKAAGLPVYKLMGGAFRTRIQPYATGFYRRAGLTGQDEALVAEAEMHARSGFRAMKLKLGFGFEEDRRCVRAVRRALGNEMHWMADANHAYDASTALRLGRVLEENGYEWLEEPVTPEDQTS